MLVERLCKGVPFDLPVPFAHLQSLGIKAVSPLSKYLHNDALRTFETDDESESSDDIAVALEDAVALEGEAELAAAGPIMEDAEVEYYFCCVEKISLCIYIYIYIYKNIFLS